ncbi:MAG: type II secretion system F family protein [Phycisphaerales bacterium]|nr:MAG: type II secretion system F family protein [Phycisphaerales bacterium]
MILTYDAINAEGHSVNNTIEAPDSRAAVQELRRQGLYVTRVSEELDRRGSRAAGSRSSKALRLPLKTLVLFTRQLAMLLRAGSGIVPAMMAIKRQMKKAGQAALLGKIIEDLEDGARLTDALRKHPGTFDPVYCAIISAGEASGTLTEMFERLASVVGKRRALRNKVVGALAYPALLIFMCGNILLALVFFVLPRFNNMFVQLGVDTPATTKLLLSIGDLVAGYWPVVLGVLIVGGMGAVAMLTSATGQQWLSNVQIRIPVIGPIRSRLIQGQVFRTMGTLLESGVGVLDALELVRKSTRNNRFQKLFGDLDDVVTSGGLLSSAFEASRLVEPYTCQAIHTGEDSGNLGGALTYCAEMLDETNSELINALMRLMEPVILIGMGLVVGGVAVSLFLPLFDLTSAIR